LNCFGSFLPLDGSELGECEATQLILALVQFNRKSSSLPSKVVLRGLAVVHALAMTAVPNLSSNKFGMLGYANGCGIETLMIFYEEGVFQVGFNNQFMLQWPNLSPLALLRELQSKYENQSRPEVEALVDLLLRAGVDQGYLNRPCLDPTDLSCPKQAPNHQDSPPDVARILSAGCPGFAANILHWPRDIIVGGRRCSSPRHAASENLTVPCSSRHPEESGRLMTASTLQSLILLRSPMDLYRTVYQNDPYKLDVWTLADAQNVLDQWREGLKQLLIVHNQAIAPALPWRYSTLTDNSVRELFSQNTYQIPVVKILGAVFLMLLYSLLCLLGWREPSRSQCWLALFGLVLSVLALLAGLGVCAIFGLHFNVLTVQVLPFLALGLGMEGLFTFTTCHTCMLARGIAVARKSGQPNVTASSSSAAATPRVLTEHGTGLIFGALAMSAAFFSAVVIPVPLVKQFSLQVLHNLMLEARKFPKRQYEYNSVGNSILPLPPLGLDSLRISNYIYVYVWNAGGPTEELNHRCCVTQQQNPMMGFTGLFQSLIIFDQGWLRPRQPPAPSPISGLFDSVMTPGSGGGGGESAVDAAQVYYHFKLNHAQFTVSAPPFRGAYG
uniref:SSD domain-containing protein n=1 Tax=Schistocephalus solidus TaxID=70667 RepID=A0A183SWW3_SCHSO